MVKSSQYVELANDLEINKAITYLRQKDFNQVSVLNTCMHGWMDACIGSHLVQSLIVWDLVSCHGKKAHDLIIVN